MDGVAVIEARASRGDGEAAGRGAALREAVALLRLAAPVVVAELGWMAMGIVDTLFVGPLGKEAIGAVGLGAMLHFSVAILGTGMLLGLDTLVAHAFGAGRREECRQWLGQGLWLAALATIPLMIAVEVLTRVLPWIGVEPAVVGPTQQYLRAVNLGTGPLLAYFALRRYVQAVGRPLPVAVALVSANGMNALANWALVYGRLGMPAMGVTGAGVATSISRLWMAGVLAVVVLIELRRAGVTVSGLMAWDGVRLRRLAGLGLPAAGQVWLEVGMFAAATSLAGRLGAASLAAHQIALQSAGLSYMVPLGLSSAAAVRVGQAVGRRDAAGARRAGLVALLVGVGFMTIPAIVFLCVPRPIIRLFTTEADVLQLGGNLLLVAALFQLFDGLQVMATGVLRGLGDTRTPFYANLLAHWFVGLPLCWVLGFPAGGGVVGVWLGLSAGLMVAGVVLLGVWVRGGGVGRTRLVSEDLSSARGGDGERQGG